MRYSRGNILFLILIGVALFGALAYAVTQGSRGGGKGDISDEQADIAASQAIQMADDIATAVSRLQIVRGCEDDEFDFAEDVTVSFSDGTTLLYPEGHNSNAPTNGRCSIFKPEGAGVIAKALPSEITINSQSAGQAIIGGWGPVVVDLAGVGSDTQNDLVIYLPYIKEEVCVKINEKLGITNPGGSPPVEPRGGGIRLYDGILSATATHGDDVADLYGKNAYCIFVPSGWPDDHDFAFIRLLIAR